MAKLAEEERAYYHVLRIVLVAHIKGMPPVLAVETARRAVPSHVRPSFAQLEQACKNRGGAPGEAAPEGAPAGAAA
jgi:chemotaxis protein MotA